jgi:hypothetical protein
MALDPYDRVIWRGKTMDVFTVAFMTAVEHDLGRPIDSVFQGSYSSGVSASAGTHSGGGAADVWDRDPTRLVSLMRKHGGAAWNRTGKGNWTAHIHVIVGGCKAMSSAARAQWEDYQRGGDALSPYNGQGDYHSRAGADLNGFDWGKSAVAAWSHGDVYVSKLKKGTRGSDSVRRLQYRLHNHDKIPGRDVVIDGHYGEQTERAVQFWQRNIRDAEVDRDGTRLTNVQANILMGENYVVHETD